MHTGQQEAGALLEMGSAVRACSAPGLELTGDRESESQCRQQPSDMGATGVSSPLTGEQEGRAIDQRLSHVL